VDGEVGPEGLIAHVVAGEAEDDGEGDDLAEGEGALDGEGDLGVAAEAGEAEDEALEQVGADGEGGGDGLIEEARGTHDERSEGRGGRRRTRSGKGSAASGRSGRIADVGSWPVHASGQGRVPTEGELVRGHGGVEHHGGRRTRLRRIRWPVIGYGSHRGAAALAGSREMDS
jgi:hypothetical protein